MPVIDLTAGSGDVGLSRVLIAQGRGRAHEPLLVAIPIGDDARLQRIGDGSRRVTVAGPTEVVHGVFEVGSLQVGLVNIAAVAGAAVNDGDRTVTHGRVAKG